METIGRVGSRIVHSKERERGDLILRCGGWRELKEERKTEEQWITGNGSSLLLLLCTRGGVGAVLIRK